MQRKINFHRSANGFTLIEMIVVMVLLGILAAFGMGILTYPVRGMMEQSRRGELLDMADNALQRMSRELRQALPNSIRLQSGGNRFAIEYLNTIAGGRYRAHLESDGSGNALINASADNFDVLGTLLGAAAISYSGNPGQSECLSGASHCLVLYNTGTGAGDYNAYAGDNIAAITNLSGNQLSFDNGAGWSFPFSIPPTLEQRFYVVDTPVSFVCDTGNNILWRYSNYSIASTQPISSADFSGASANRLALNIAACQFDYNAGAGSRHGLVTLRITVQDAASNERVVLLHQVHVLNVP